MMPPRDWQYRWPLLRRVLSPLTVALIIGLLVGVGSAALQIHDTLSRVRQGLPAEILRQSGDVARLVQSLGEVLRAVELAELDPDSERRQRALERNELLLVRLEAIREGYVFDNQVGAAAVHAVINPAAEDIGRWLTEGLPGLAADSPVVLELVRVRVVQAYDRARALANEAGETALGLMEQESARLEQFRISMMIFLTVLVLLTLGLVGVLVARRLAEVRLETLRRQLADAIESIPEGFVLCDAQDRVVVCNDRYRHMYQGIDALAWPGADFEAVVRAFLENNPLIGSQSDLEEVLAARMTAHRQPRGPFEHELADGRRIRITERRTRDGGYVGIHADITDVRRVQERLHHLAHHDPLTGLPNRSYGQERLEQSLARARRRQDSFAVLYLDLDRFKLVNDTLGHHVGDELLRAVARRLRSNLREEDTLARLGGDEFMILLEADEATALISAQRLVSALAQPFQMGGHEVLVTTSIGIALYPQDGADGDTLMQNADAASYWAKAQGPNNYRVYTPDLNAEARSRVELESALRQAIAQGGLVIHYQPRFDLAASRLTGAEALLRWHHPQRGLLEPEDFLELAEDSGLILPMGEWVLEEACRQYRQWQILGLAPPALAINLSIRQLRQPGFADWLGSLLGRIGLEPTCLELELTESFLLEDPQVVLEVLDRLHALGVRLTLDDFGRGYSSLGLLSRLPLSVLKIDQVFLQDMEDQAALPTVEAILALGRALGLEVVAEGVETVGQREWLRSRGCQEVQGFLLGRPLPPGELEQVLRSVQGHEASAGAVSGQDIGS